MERQGNSASSRYNPEIGDSFEAPLLKRLRLLRRISAFLLRRAPELKLPPEDDDKKKQNDLLDRRIAAIREAREMRNPTSVDRAARAHGYVAVGHSASGVIFKGR